MRFAPLLLIAVLSTGTALPVMAQYDPVLESPGAAEQLRLGVQAYHRGRYAESILLLEKSLAYAPNEDLIQYWLGRAYAKSGHTETALRTWQALLDAPDAPPFLRAKAEYLRSTRSIAPLEREYRYVEAARFSGASGAEKFFHRPTALLPLRDGGLLLVAHGSDELLRIDSSGVVLERQRGGLQGFERPFGLARLPDGTVFLSEFSGDRLSRIAPDGSVRLLGGKGRGPGQLIGPQFIAADGEGSIYVTEFGNARVSKFDSEGSFLFSFGGDAPDTGFPGFASPTGVLEKDGIVYVADSYRKSLYRFDSSGNYLGSLAEGELRSPEGLSLWDNGRAILVADSSRIVSVDIETEETKEVYRPTDKRPRILAAVPDFNGNIAICDFDASTVSILSESYLLASGYDLEIERIMSDDFPFVQMEVSVRDRLGNPVVGLREGNFHLTERVRRTTQADEAGKAIVRVEDSIEPVADLEYRGAGQLAEGMRVTILIERTTEAYGQAGAIRTALEELYTLFGGNGGPALVTAGPSPAFQTAGNLAEAVAVALTPPAGSGRFDLGLRLAATGLLPARARDAVVYLGTGAMDEGSFSATSLSELSALLAGNGIRFYAVVLGQAAAPLRFLAERSGGGVFTASRPRGLGDIAEDLRSAPSGRYLLSYRSKADPIFGRAHLSVAAEAYLYKKSGKDELGYYAPLQ